MPRAKHYGRGVSPARKGLVSGELEGGVHWHRLDRSAGKTDISGRHRHVFQLPTGEKVMTDEDGAHGHTMDGEWLHGGEHVHSVTLPSGEVIQTEVGGSHGHGTQTESTQLDGDHQHVMVFADVTLQSLSVRDTANADGPSDSIDNTIAEASAVARGEVYMRFGKRAQLELAIGRDRWLIDIGRVDLPEDLTVSKGEAIAKTFSVDGSVHFLPLTEARRVVKANDLDRPYHAQRDDLDRLCFSIARDIEFDRGLDGEFFAAAGPIRGRIVIEQNNPTYQKDHKATLVVEPDGFPSVLKSEQVPCNYSGLPRAMEAQVPAPLRYWETDDVTKRLAIHKRLRDVGLFTAESTMLTPAGVAKVHIEKEFFAFEPDAVLEPADVVKQLIAGRAVDSPMGGDHWRHAMEKAEESDTVQFFDVADDVGILEDVVAQLQKRVVPFLVMADDGDAQRELLSKVGRVFKHTAGAFDQVFAASFPAGPLVVTIDPTSPAPAPDAAQAAADSAFIERADTLISKASQWIVTKEEGEERFILGIVAEPDEVDTQQDTIQTHTIRTAAHKFMEDFRNIGLQHQTFVNGRVKILESYVTLVDQEINGQVVKAGSWVLGVRVVDDRIWKAVKDGSFTGFSLGGTAVREPTN